MSSSLGAEGESTEGSRARAEPRRAFQAVRGLRGTLVPARTRAESRAAAREGVSGAAKVRKGVSEPADAGREQLRSWEA